MAEWFNAAVLKTAVPQGTQSSNLCPSAMKNKNPRSIRKGIYVFQRDRDEKFMPEGVNLCPSAI